MLAIFPVEAGVNSSVETSRDLASSQARRQRELDAAVTAPLMKSMQPIKLWSLKILRFNKDTIFVVNVTENKAH